MPFVTTTTQQTFSVSDRVSCISPIEPKRIRQEKLAIAYINEDGIWVRRPNGYVWGPLSESDLRPYREPTK